MTLYVKPRECTYKKVLLGYKSTVPIPPSHQTSCAVILTHARAGDLIPSLKPDTWIDYSGTRQQVHYVRTYYSIWSPTKIPRHFIPVSVPANLLRFIHLRDLVVLPPDPGDAVLQEADALEQRSLETDAHIKYPNILLCYSKLEFKYTWKSSGSPAMSSSPFASGLSGWRPRSAKVIGLSLHFSIRFSNICSKYSNWVYVSLKKRTTFFVGSWRLWALFFPPVSLKGFQFVLKIRMHTGRCGGLLIMCSDLSSLFALWPP